LPPALPIRPFSGPVSGRVRMPGSKSITNRALVLSALSKGRTVIQNALFSEDTRIMLEALRMLGFEVQVNETESTIEVEGEAGRIPSTGAELDVGNSGTSARFLTAFCCLADTGTFQIDGVEQMRQRPLGGLVAALRAVGAQIEVSADGGIPIRIHPRGLKGGSITIDATASSQLLSAILMVGPHASSDLKIRLSDTRVRRPYVDMTIGMMRDFGMDEQRLSVSDDLFTIRSGSGYSRDNETYAVESDASAASYFLALPAVVGGQLEVEDLKLDGLQGDAAFAKTILGLGCDLHKTVSGIRISRAGNVSKLSGIEQDFFQISDTFLTLAALAPLLGKPTTITGIAHTRKQETDRVSAVARELRKLGQDVMESEDALTIHPRPLREAVVDTYHDHRIAMSFSILGCYDLHGTGQPWMTIINPSTCAKTFPSFYQVLEDLRLIT
jgi:3-phosphoshikimate 1-carboxyvinyltransferase